MNKNTFSENLIGLRKLKGLTQGDLAKLSGLSKRIIAYYETKANNDFIDKLQKIAKALNVSASSLIGEENTISSTINDVLNIDIRLLKKLKKITKLSIDDQKAINSYLDMIIERDNLKNKHAQNK